VIVGSRRGGVGWHPDSVDTMNTTRIAQLRKERGMTQEQLAFQAGISVRTVQRLESGEDMSLSTLNLVANALKVDVRDLFSGIENPNLSGVVEGLDQRRAYQWSRRIAIERTWNGVYPFVGLIFTMVVVGVNASLHDGISTVWWIAVGAYWAAGHFLFKLPRDLWVMPWLDRKYPLTLDPSTRPKSAKDAA
jgi:transcriptional regulator with XRE-family HTH domain